jgi:hypothetical protein
MMESAPPSDVQTSATSRLLIHADAREGGGFMSIAGLLRRIRAAVQHTSNQGPASPTLEIRDLQGHRVLTLSHATSVVDVVLPSGTYHVTTQLGLKSRSYTVALEHGTTTDLYLNPEPPTPL